MQKKKKRKPHQKNAMKCLNKTKDNKNRNKMKPQNDKQG